MLHWFDCNETTENQLCTRSPEMSRLFTICDAFKITASNRYGKTAFFEYSHLTEKLKTIQQILISPKYGQYSTDCWSHRWSNILNAADLLPPSESCSSLVSLESRYGTWHPTFSSSPRAEITLPRDSCQQAPENLTTCRIPWHLWLFYPSSSFMASNIWSVQHQYTEWMILSHVDCFIQGEVVGFQVLLDSVHPRSTRASRWFPPVLQRGSWATEY